MRACPALPRAWQDTGLTGAEPATDSGEVLDDRRHTFGTLARTASCSTLTVDQVQRLIGVERGSLLPA